VGGAGRHEIRVAGLPLTLVAVMFVCTLSSVPVTSATSSCDVPPSSDWSQSMPEDYIEVSTVDDGGGFEGIFGYGSPGNSLKPLERGLSTEWSDGTWSGFQGVAVMNDSATTLSMVLIPGYRYTFCIDFSHSGGSAASEARGDIYLMTDQNYGMYTVEYGSRGFGDFEIDMVPVEWRDMSTWLPFRDSHAYESVSYGEFSVAIDSTGSAWSSLGLQDGAPNQVYHLVLDGWDNSRVGDSGATGGAMNVEILIDVEERQTLPNYTAYMLIGALPLSCIIIPLILHSRYHSAALTSEEEEMREVPFLRDG